MLIDEREWGVFIYVMVSAYRLGLHAEFLKTLVGFQGKLTAVLCYENRVVPVRSYKHT